MRNILILSFLLFSPVTLAQDERQFSEIPVELSSRVSFPLFNTITFSYFTNEPEKVFQHLVENKNIKLDLSNNEIRLELDRATTLNGPPLESHSKSSFVIDLEEESTKKFLSGFDIGKHNEASPNHSKIMYQIREYANNFIEVPTYVNGFLIASKVAALKSGDCTEYAVLTTSLARHLNYPARYITGLVLVGEENNVQAFGHAWTEMWYDNRWHIIDAAMYGADDDKLYYLPISTLSNEGPGYLFSLAETVVYLPSKITKLNNI